MSIDRLSNKSGYSFPNVRLVRQVVNFLRGANTLATAYELAYMSMYVKGVMLSSNGVRNRDRPPDRWEF